MEMVCPGAKDNDMNFPPEWRLSRSGRKKPAADVLLGPPCHGDHRGWLAGSKWLFVTHEKVHRACGDRGRAAASRSIGGTDDRSSKHLRIHREH
jgi:hypothetical protein